MLSARQLVSLYACCLQSMNKLEFIEQLGARLGITHSEAERFVNAFINLIYEVLKGGGKVNMSGFGQFSVSHRKERIGVNPRQPSQRITIPELNTPKFKAGDTFKEMVKLRKTGPSEETH